MTRQDSVHTGGDRLKLLVLSAMVDGTDVSEPYFAFKWVEALSHRHDVTLLTLQRRGRLPTAKQLPNVRVVTWEEPGFLGRAERFRAIAKPGWSILCHHAKRWIKREVSAGRGFDIAHQLYPAAMRHRSPLRHGPIPYVVGPLAGMLSNPKGFEDELRSSAAVDAVRKLDALRLRFDPGLRASFTAASAVIGVAPYVRGVLGALPLQRFVVELEAAGGEAKPRPTIAPPRGCLKLLHVGRGIRTKGLRDAVRALALLKDLPQVTLTSAGRGDDLVTCRQEAEELGVADRVTFLGQVSRGEVDRLYAAHDVFVFPSFREPMGSVFFEAMSWGLPIITARRGGPEAIFSNGGAELIDVDNPGQFAADIAAAIRRFVNDPSALQEAAAASRRCYREIGDWDAKAARATELYRSILSEPRRRAAEELGQVQASATK